MRLKAVYLNTNAYVTRRGNHTQQLLASEKLSLDFDIATASIRVDDREPGGDGFYHVPIGCVRLWVPLPEEKQQKKAANQ